MAPATRSSGRRRTSPPKRTAPEADHQEQPKRRRKGATSATGGTDTDAVNPAVLNVFNRRTSRRTRNGSGIEVVLRSASGEQAQTQEADNITVGNLQASAEIPDSHPKPETYLGLEEHEVLLDKIHEDLQEARDSLGMDVDENYRDPEGDRGTPEREDEEPQAPVVSSPHRLRQWTQAESEAHASPAGVNNHGVVSQSQHSNGEQAGQPQKAPKRGKPRKAKPVYQEGVSAQGTKAIASAKAAGKRPLEEQIQPEWASAIGKIKKKRSLNIRGKRNPYDQESSSNHGNEEAEEQAEDGGESGHSSNALEEGGDDDEEADEQLRLENDQERQTEEVDDPEGRRDSLFVEAPSTTEAQLTVSLKTQKVKQMFNLMSRSGWTGLGSSWVSGLIRNRDAAHADLDDKPRRTTEVRKSWKYLVILYTLYDVAPRAPNFAQQNQWLRQQQEDTAKFFDAINKMVKTICRKLDATDQQENLNRSELRLRSNFRNNIVGDLCWHVIPMLVALLYNFSLLGGADKDAKGDLVPAPAALFTATTLSYVARITGWIFRLDKVLMDLIEEHPPEDERETQGSSALLKVQTLKKSRREVGKPLKELREGIDRALAELDHEARRRQRRREEAEREAGLQLETEAAERAELEERERRWNAMCASTHRMRKAPHPVWNITPLAADARRGAEAQREAEEAAEARRRDALELAAEHQAARLREIEAAQRAAAELRERQWNAMCASTHRMRVGRNQVNDIWTPAPSQNLPRPALMGASSSAVNVVPSTQGSVAPRNASPVASREMWPEEDSQWLLTQLRSLVPGKQPNVGMYAECLEREAADVMFEIELLKKAFRSLAREKGVAVPGWAQKGQQG